MRKLKVIGNGSHPLTRVIDADTGEDIGAQLGASRVSVQIGGGPNFPAPTLVLEITQPFELELLTAGDQLSAA